MGINIYLIHDLSAILLHSSARPARGGGGKIPGARTS